MSNPLKSTFLVDLSIVGYLVIANHAVNNRSFDEQDTKLQYEYILNVISVMFFLVQESQKLAVEKHWRF